MGLNSQPYIAELHDIGKLADRQALQQAGLQISGHTYHNFDFAQLSILPPSFPSWWGQWSDSIRSVDATGGLPAGITDEDKASVVLTNIADTLAASISRTWGKKGDVEEGVRLLWQPAFYDGMVQQGKHWAAFRTPDDLKRMFAIIDQCQDPEDFLDEFGDNLQLTPEDKSAPLNFISLRTHLELTGKVFRVLRYWSNVIHEGGKPKIEYNGQKIGNVTEAAGGRAGEDNRGKWVFRLVQCHVKFPQALARVQDLNVLRLRREKIEEIVEAQKVGGNVERQPFAVLFYTDDYLALFLPKESLLSMSQIMRPLLAEGFWLEYEELEAELNLLTSTGDRTRQQLIKKYGDRETARARRHFELRHLSLWPDLEEVLTPPLCDLCQQRQGAEYVKDQVHEWLCPVCHKIRAMGEPASAISDWEGAEKPVVWLKISLDQGLLLQCLRRLFENYVDNGSGMQQVSANDRQALKDGFRPLAAQMEFVNQYQEFLEEFQGLLCGEDGGKSRILEQDTVLYPVGAYRELMVIRLDRPEALGLVLDAFYSLLEQYFPECMIDCPIRLSASLSNIKYPYQEHWRFLEMEQSPGVIFDLQQPGVRRVPLTGQQFRALRDKLRSPRLAHFLHRLSDIEAEAGELTAMTEAFGERSRFMQGLMWQYKLSFRQVLDFYRLVDSADEEVAVHG